MLEEIISVGLAKDGAACTLEGEALPVVRRCGIWASNRVNRDVLGELEV